MNFSKLWKEFTTLPEVESIALGGSRVKQIFDEKSDYDLYIYCNEIPSKNARRRILEKYCHYMELGNSYWELEDNCTLKDGIDIDILYRNLEDFSQQIYSVVEEFTPSNGYTTCMWHNLLHCNILFDKNGKLEKLQNKYQISYPEELSRNIIQNNMNLLTGNLPSYDKQIEKVLIRKDIVSINHRVAAFLESYFDMIFAINRLTHPGEKRMITYAKTDASILPEAFEENLEGLFQNKFEDSEKTLEILKDIIIELKKVV